MSDEPTDLSTEQPTPTRPRPSWQEPVVITLAIVLLTIVYYHGRPNTLPPEVDLFTWKDITFFLPTHYHQALFEALGLHDAHQQKLFNWFGVNFLLLFCIPALVIRLGLRRPLAEFGLQWGEGHVWGKYFLGFLLVTLPAVLLSSRWPSFQSYYSSHLWAGESLRAFGVFAGGWLVYFFAWEFFFRGFLLFGLARSMGKLAIFIQMVPFVMMHFRKPEMESYAAIIAGLALGFMAYRGKSWLGCWLLHWIIALLMYTVVIALA